MHITKLQARTMASFMEALLPEAEFGSVRNRMGDIGNEIIDPNLYDDALLRRSVPGIFTVIYLLPILCWWLILRPVPFTSLSLKSRQRLFYKLEHSRVYALRGLYIAAKMFACMIYFHDEETWDYVGFDNQGELPLEINRTALDDLRESA